MNFHVNSEFFLFIYLNYKLKQKRLYNLKKYDEELNKKRKLFKKQQSILFNKYQNLYTNVISEYAKYLSSMNISTRSIGYYIKSDRIWRSFIKEDCTENQWNSAFRISKQMFFELCKLLTPYLEPRPNYISNNDRVLSVEKQIAVTLFKLASCSEYRVVADIFGIHKSTVQQTFYKVISVFNEYLVLQLIKLPNEREADYISSDFEKTSDIPRIVCCIDGTHIPVLPPKDGYRDFINRKGWASVVLQLAVDNHLLIRDFSCIMPGSVHDAYAFKQSNFSTIFPKTLAKNTASICGTDVPFLVIGDPAYPLLNWLIKDYIGTNLDSEKDLFNKKLNRARVKVEIAIGRLKSRWRLLLKRSDINYTFMPKVISACCCLHNIIEKTNSNLSETTDFAEIEGQNNFTQPPGLLNTNDTVEGSVIRNALCKYLCEKQLLNN